MPSVELEANIKDGFTPTIVRWKEGVTGVDAAVKGLNETIESQTQNMRSQQAAIDKTSAALREASRAEEDAAKSKRVSRDETQKMSDALADSIIRLRTQRDLLADPVFAKQVQYQQSLRAEIDQMTKSVLGTKVAQEAENEAVGLTVRSRRELMVMMHELSQGRYKNLAGSAMVLEEGEGGAMGAIKAATAALGGPYVVAAGLATVATVGVAAALWKASEAEAEMVHKTELLGQTLGVSGEAIRGFQYLAVGTGVTTEELGRVFGIFEKNLGKNSEKFRELGITARDPMAAFEQVMDKAKGMGDALERSAFLNETLGRGWEKTAPAILQGGEAMREAIKAMEIPEAVLRNFDRANEAQIQIDKDFNTLSVSSGAFFSGFRANAKEFEQSLLDMLTGADSFQQEVDRHAKEAGLDKKMGGPGLSEDDKKTQVDASEAARKQLSKKSVEAAVADVQHEWESKINAYKEGNEKWKKTYWTIGSDPTGEYQRAHDEYTKIIEAEQMAEDDVRKSWAKKGIKHIKAKRDESVYGTTHADADFERSTGISYGAYSMAHPGGTEVDGPGRGASVTRGMAAEDEKKAKKAADDQKKWIKEVQDAQANSAKITLNWDGAIADARKREHDEHMKRIQAEGDLVQSFASREIQTALQGGMTKKQLEKDFSNFLIQQIVERGTKWIEEEAIKLAFSEGAAIASTATSVTQAGIASSAWSAPSMMASIGTFGGATAAGEASWFQAMAAGEAFGMAAHAKGGTQFGGWARINEEGYEHQKPVVPTQIYQASHTSTTNNNGETHFHFHGMSERDALRVIDRARTNNTRSSH